MQQMAQDSGCSICSKNSYSGSSMITSQNDILLSFSRLDDIKYIWWNNPNLKVDHFSLIFQHRNNPVEKYSHPRQCQGVERADYCNHNNGHKPSSPQYFDTSGGRVCFSHLSLHCTGQWTLDKTHRDILTTERVTINVNIITMPMFCLS